MSYKLSEFNLMPGRLLVLPQKQESNEIIESAASEKELSIGLVVKTAPIQYDFTEIGPVPSSTDYTGKLVCYERLHAAPVVLEDEQGVEHTYRFLLEKDIAGYFEGGDERAEKKLSFQDLIMFGESNLNIPIDPANVHHFGRSLAMERFVSDRDLTRTVGFGPVASAETAAQLNEEGEPFEGEFRAGHQFVADKWRKIVFNDPDPIVPPTIPIDPDPPTPPIKFATHPLADSMANCPDPAREGDLRMGYRFKDGFWEFCGAPLTTPDILNPAGNEEYQRQIENQVNRPVGFDDDNGHKMYGYDDTPASQSDPEFPDVGEIRQGTPYGGPGTIINPRQG